ISKLHLVFLPEPAASFSLKLFQTHRHKQKTPLISHKNSDLLVHSGARINISEGSCPERIITITGPTDCVFRAFTMITFKLEEVRFLSFPHVLIVSCFPPPPLSLLHPISPCSFPPIFFPTTGAQVQVAGDLLPNSTEREVTISGGQDAIIQCVKLICTVILESPPKGATIPYRPSPSPGTMLLAGNQVSFMAGNQVSFTGASGNLFSASVSATVLPGTCASSFYSDSFLFWFRFGFTSSFYSLFFSTCLLFNPLTLLHPTPPPPPPPLPHPPDPCPPSTLRAPPCPPPPPSSSLETAKSTAQSSSMSSPVDLTMTMGAALPHAPILGAPYAFPLSSLLGVKSIPYLALSTPPASAAAAAAAAISSSANGMKKPERQKFSPY
uniref:Poly(rC) binding protein 4 n=1 Tax=Fundulus heteroclitus TaxID=8078 RepID=A0A3Q2PE69_FUNHE